MLGCLAMLHVGHSNSVIPLRSWVLLHDQTLAGGQAKENCSRLLDCRSCVKVTLSLPSRGMRVSAAAFGLFTLVCRDINTLVCFHINSDMSKAVCEAESLTVLKKAKQTLNVIMDVVKIRNRSKWKCGE